MIVELHKYRANIPFIKIMLDRGLGQVPIISIISLAAVVTGVPVIVVTYYVGEMLGFTLEITTQIERLKVFYKYTKIVENKS